MVSPLAVRFDGPQLPMIFDVSVGTRKEDRQFRAEIEAALARRSRDVDALLASYGVPRPDPEAAPGKP
jgi:mxaJ protein